MLTTISNSSPPIEQHPQVLCFMMNDLKRKKGGSRKRKKKDLKRKKGSGNCQSDRPSKNISLLPDLPRYRSETGHEINKGQEKWRNSMYFCYALRNESSNEVILHEGKPIFNFCLCERTSSFHPKIWQQRHMDYEGIYSSLNKLWKTSLTCIL